MKNAAALKNGVVMQHSRHISKLDRKTGWQGCITKKRRAAYIWESLFSVVIKSGTKSKEHFLRHFDHRWQERNTNWLVSGNHFIILLPAGIHIKTHTVAMCHKTWRVYRVLRKSVVNRNVSFVHRQPASSIEFYDYGARDASNKARHSINFAQ